MYQRKKLTIYIKERSNEKALANTRVSVKLRKSEYREEWYLYVEAYPVFQADKPTPQRVREYLNRTITTPIWDKSRNARTDKDGKTTYKPKRDLNGIIQCKSQLDQESCIYADKVRSLRQKEYDNASLYSETDAEQAEQLERSRYNFIEYFDHVQRTRHAHSSDSIIANWNRVYELLKIFQKAIPFLFADRSKVCRIVPAIYIERPTRRHKEWYSFSKHGIHLFLHIQGSIEASFY